MKIFYVKTILAKKAAMFGLDCRALRKQFGELFLVSRHSEASQGGSGSCGYYKHGAMFGLDARIALAIFGALSVISGAALFSAIKESKMNALLADVKEIGMAWEQYLLDTGTDLPRWGNSYTIDQNRRDLSYLVEDNGVDGWSGPYLNYETYSSYNQLLIYPKLDPYISGEDVTFSIVSASDSTSWGGDNVNWDSGYCSSDTDCYLWIEFLGVGEDFYEDLDEKIDNGDGATTGDFKWVYNRPGGNDRIFFKYTAYARPT